MWCDDAVDDTMWRCRTTIQDNSMVNDVVRWLVRQCGTRCSTMMQYNDVVQWCGTMMWYDNWYDSTVRQCGNMQHDNMWYDMWRNITLHIMPHILPQISFLYRTFWYFGSLISLFCALHLINYIYLRVTTSRAELSRAEHDKYSARLVQDLYYSNSARLATSIKIKLSARFIRAKLRVLVRALGSFATLAEGSWRGSWYCSVGSRQTTASLRLDK